MGEPSFSSDPAARPDAARRRLRVLMGTDTYPPDVNGAALFTARLARGLAERGVDLHMVCPSPDGAPRVAGAEGVVEHRLRSMPSLVHELVRLALPPGAPGHIDRLMRRLRPDAVHIQNHFIVGRLLLGAARRHGVPVVATNHFMPENLFAYLRCPPALRGALGAYAWRDFVRVYSQADRVTTPTRIAARLLRDKGFHRAVEAVSCGTDLDRFRPLAGGAAARSAVRARLGVPDRPTMVFVGRLDAEKNIADLVEALPHVTAPGAQLVVAGSGSQRRHLEALAAEHGVADRVHLLGHVPNGDLPDVYHSGDVFTIAGTAELQSIATLEAMASGLPVVAADALALPHLVRPGHNGYLYQPGAAGELAKYVSEILAAPEERARMGRACRRRAARHDHQVSCARYEEIYRDLARPWAARSG
ncbi:glycosyltransferase [Streptomonospora nanhaiensis]|uniref:Glycosyltransferase involved in cell wall biosynthesis n=1 Tax=Streptomonospora nanhaiensis TaxID=1323731 RepID=A0A853BTI5_9ACTN|nr:glycosyltransferase [Streptomonospora nanhaiensis]MBV2363821.1 glycosyltransferase [Streptomonospora nanhaiensis]NYI97612.1 glycosyltransferase involved in cell wall biosynthesis [Streptomonospora nanhaiensis]